jgi:hypothetical protein
MNEDSPIKGSCLCGRVAVELSKAPKAFEVCHCDMCRKWTGGAGMSVDAGEHVKFSGGEFVGRYSSSEWAERGYCKTCGTHLFYRLKKTDHYFVYLGLFGDAISPRFDVQDFIDEKPAYYAFANETKLRTKAEAHLLLEKYLSKP